MNYFLLDISLAAFCCSLGVLSGWWLRSRGAKPLDQSDAVAEREFAQNILASVQEVAQSVAKDMGQHSTRVKEISDEIAEGDDHSPEKVIAAIGKLVEANDKMQQQLELADRTMKTQEEQIAAHATAAMTDALTGLANRRALDAKLSAIASLPNVDERLATVMLCDVDHFKKFNDTHGHLAGDEVLRGVAKVLGSAVRDIDFVARYGGEEFAIVFPSTPWQEAASIADRVRQAVADACFEFEGTELRVTISMGVAQYANPETIARWIQRADEGLYASKTAGRNCGHAHDGNDFVAIKEVLSQDCEAERNEVSPASEPEPSAREEDQSDLENAGALPKAQKPLAKAGRRATHLVTPIPELMSKSAFLHIAQLRLAEYKRGGSELAMIVLEIDGLQNMIQERGEECGAVIVRATAQFLQATMRDMDVVSRLDEGTFALLLPSAALSDACQVAERLRRATARCKLEAANEQFCVTVSLGVAAGKTLDSAEEFMGRAQEALLEAGKQTNVTFVHTATACVPSSDFLAMAE